MGHDPFASKIDIAKKVYGNILGIKEEKRIVI